MGYKHLMQKDTQSGLYYYTHLAMLIIFASYYLAPTAQWQKFAWYAAIGLFVTGQIRCWLRCRQSGVTADTKQGRGVSLHWVIAAYIGYQLISYSWNQEFSPSELGDLLRKSLLTWLFVIIAARSMRHRPRFIDCMVVISAACAINAGYSFYDWITTQQTGARLVGIGQMPNPIQTACLYAVALLASGWVVMQPEIRNKPLWLGAVLLCWVVIAAALLATQSRGAWLGVMAGYGVLFCLPTMLNKRTWLLFAIGGVIAAVIASFSLDWHSIIARADGFRFFVWRHALELWQHSPWLGLGFRADFTLTLPYGDTIYQPHSLYVSALYYGGICGLMVLFMLFAATAMRLWQYRTQHSTALLGMAWLSCAAVIGLVDYDLLLVNLKSEWMVFWLPIAVAVAIEHYQPPQEIAA